MEYRINTIDNKSFVVVSDKSTQSLTEDMFCNDILIFDLCVFKNDNTNGFNTNTIIIPSKNISSIEYYKKNSNKEILYED